MNNLWKNVWRLARGLLAFHAVLATVAWFFLPSRIPTHFGPGGKPDDWDSPSFFTWFILVAVSFGAQCLIQALLSPAFRSSWNIPKKERFLSLPAEQQAPVIELMQRFGGFSALCVSLTFIALHTGMYLTAHGYTKGLPWYIQVGIFAPVACMLIGLIPFSQSMEKTMLNATSQ